MSLLTLSVTALIATIAGTRAGEKFGGARGTRWLSLLVALCAVVIFAEAFSGRVCTVVCDPCGGDADFGSRQGPGLWPAWINWISAGTLAFCIGFVVGAVTRRFSWVTSIFVSAGVFSAAALVAWLLLSDCPQVIL